MIFFNFYLTFAQKMNLQGRYTHREKANAESVTWYNIKISSIYLSFEQAIVFLHFNYLFEDTVPDNLLLKYHNAPIPRYNI